MKTKKCSTCKEIKSLTDFPRNKSGPGGLNSHCKICHNQINNKWRNTKRGYLVTKYNAICAREKIRKGNPNSIKCHFTFDELLTAFEKHKSIYGMRSAWGPGPKHLEQHLPITMINQGTKRTKDKKTPRQGSNLSVDRLDTNRDYTLQNIIFIRNDENRRKNNTSYEDCKIQIRLHEERFMKDKKIISGDITSPKM